MKRIRADDCCWTDEDFSFRYRLCRFILSIQLLTLLNFHSTGEEKYDFLVYSDQITSDMYILCQHIDLIYRQ